jgi:cellulose synthase/poly-beta-1,6-N-acetylglucosamine synthase-like glycosyltransferase
MSILHDTELIDGENFNFHVITIEQQTVDKSNQLCDTYSLFSDPPKQPDITSYSDVLFFNRMNFYKIVISVSLCGEGIGTLEKTLKSIFKNKLKAKGLSTFDEILVIIISDGLNKLDGSVKKKLNELNLYNENNIRVHLSTNKKDKYKVKQLGFVFESRVKPQFKSSTDKVVVGLENFRNRNNENARDDEFIDFIFLVKEENKTKLNSHLWLYKFFCERLCPKYVIVSSK